MRVTQQALIVVSGLPAQYYWRDLWRYRELFDFLVWRDTLVCHKQSAIGLALGLWGV